MLSAPSFPAPHPTIWNVDMKAGAASWTLEGKGHSLEMQSRKLAGTWVPEAFVEQSSNTEPELPASGSLQERVIILHSYLSYFYFGFLWFTLKPNPD